MQAKIVSELMVPRAEYATVHRNATLFEAVQALKDVQNKFSQDSSKYKHRAILVYDDEKHIIGKISQLDVLKGLEPKYQGLDDLEKLSTLNINVNYLRNMMEEFSLWQHPIDDICHKAFVIKVEDIMHKTTKGEYIEETESINTAIHQLVIGHKQSLLVTKDNNIIGILRITDVFQYVCDMMEACKI
jgi:CBS domain-containing protein